MTSAHRSQEPPGSAEQGQVLVSEDVVSHGSSEDIRFRRVGPVSFKGVSRDVVIYEAERA